MEEYPQSLVNIPVQETPEISEVPLLNTAIKEANAALSTTGRTLVRYSGTEKLIRVMVEAKEESDVALWSKHICDAIRKTIA